MPKFRFSGYTYFRLSTGFSINEGEFPNIHVSWRRPYGVYLALSPKLKWWRFYG